MTTFGQWARSSKIPARVTWVSGNKAVLREEVIDGIRSNLKVHTRNIMKYDGADNFWPDINQLALREQVIRLSIIRNAQLVDNWTPLETWYITAKANPSLYLVFISDEIDPWLRDNGELVLTEQQLKQYQIHLRTMQKYKTFSEFIWCNDISAEKPTGKRFLEPSDAVLWMQSHCSITEWAALYLYERTAGDLIQIKNVCKKAGMFKNALTEGSIDLLVEESVGDVFIESLINLDKPKALKSISEIPIESYSSIIGSLDTTLDYVSQLNAYHKAFKTKRDAACDDKIPGYVTHLYWEPARRWDAKRVQSARASLAAVDATLSASKGLGVLEVLTALW